jgi:general secretion pathway protein I
MRARGFTLLEVMVAVAILGLGLTAILSAQAGSFAAAAHARHVSEATGLVRCKMMEVEADSLQNGFQADDVSDEGACCDGDESPKMHCSWRVEAPVMPTPELGQMDLSSSLDSSSLGPLASLLAPGGMKQLGASGGGITDVANQLFGQAGVTLPGAGGTLDPNAINPGAIVDSGSSAASTGSAGLLAGLVDPNAPPSDLTSGGSSSGGPMGAIASIVMGIIYPDLKTYFEASARRATVDVSWKEGGKVYTLTIEQWIVQPQQGIPDDTDDTDDTDDPDDTTKKHSKKSHGHEHSFEDERHHEQLQQHRRK